MREISSFPGRAMAFLGLFLLGPALRPADAEKISEEPDALVEHVERVERGNLRLEGIPDIPPALAERLRQFQAARSASVQDWLPDGTGLVITTRFGETDQLHAVDAPGAMRRQLTFYDEPVGIARVSRHPERRLLVYEQDTGGSERMQLYARDLASGRTRLLTEPTTLNGAVSWSRAGDRFAYLSTVPEEGRSEVRVMMAGSWASRSLLAEPGVWVPLDWSFDDRRLIVMRFVSSVESHPYVLDLASGARTALFDPDEPAGFGLSRFAPDGRGVFQVTDRGEAFHRLRYRDLATGEERVLTAGIDGDVEFVDLAPDGSGMVFTANVGGASRLYAMAPPFTAWSAVEDLPLGVVTGMRLGPDGRAALTLETPTSASDVFVYDPRTGRVERWTSSETGGLDPASFVEPILVHYPTFDRDGPARRMIPAWVYRPAGSGPHPVLVHIHGGPEAQARPRFDPWIQFLVGELGVAVVAPNVRGSSGYGRAFLQLDDGRRREDAVQDIGALLDWIAVEPGLDAGRVAVYGASYGGYMVLASMIRYGDRLRAGIDVVGISDFVTFLEGTSTFRRDLRRAEYGDERDPEMRAFLARISPLAAAHEIDRPLFVAQGLNDARVPVAESEQIVAAVRRSGGEVWYLLATDEGHGFRKKTNRDFFRQASALFLLEHLVSARPDAHGAP